nr:HlyD family secretion protein [Rappaport israeli]
MTIHKQAFIDLIKRYIATWRSVWQVRHELDPPKRKKDEYEFLPAHLELTESPVSAAPKWVARLIILFMFLAIIWAWFGQLDIVAVAQGKTEPNGQSKVIQSLETAEVKEINVQDGKVVKQGEHLIILSALGSDSDVNQVENARQTAQLAKWRYEALLQALETRQPPLLSPELPIADSQRLSEQILLNNQYQAWLAQDQQIRARIRQNEAEAEVIRSEISKLKELGNIENRKTEDLAKLAQQKFIAEHVYLEQKSKSLANQNDQKSKQKTAYANNGSY